MDTTLKIIGRVAITTALVFAVGACKSKKKTTDTDVPAQTEDVSQPPGIDSQAMSFDAAGSDSGKITGLQTVNFPYDKSSLSAEAKQKIQGNVDWMKAHPTSNLQIEGHCDQRGSIEYNLSLGERRAQAVKSYMTSLGIAGNRLSIISYGKEKPLTMSESDAEQARNRRANFVPINQ